MNRYIFSPLARTDFREIHDYIAEHDIDSALDVANQLEQACERLAQMPELGRKREELAHSLRSLPVGHYIIFYRITDEGVEIARVLHGARDIESIFSDEQS